RSPADYRPAGASRSGLSRELRPGIRSLAFAYRATRRHRSRQPACRTFVLRPERNTRGRTGCGWSTRTASSWTRIRTGGRMAMRTAQLNRLRIWLCMNDDGAHLIRLAPDVGAAKMDAARTLGGPA